MDTYLNSLQAQLNQCNALFALINPYLNNLVFWQNHPLKMPLILCVILFGGVFFTLRYSFVNLKFFYHAIDLVRGKFDHHSHVGEISHFQALTSALSGTVGLGNIGGVALAVSLGGPGSVFWMWVMGILGMSIKFSCCTLAQIYRRVDENGQILGGPMVYLEEGIKEHFPRLKYFGKFLGAFSAILLIFSSFGGGNMFQSNQSFELIVAQFPIMSQYSFLVGLFLAFAVGIVIIGGIQRIGDVTSKLVPLMCGIYCLCCLGIVMYHYQAIPHMFKIIFEQAFNPSAMWTGGLLGVVIQGVKRAAFSNEAGLGTSAIAHAAAKTDRPIKEGIVALLEPFIDTNVVCTLSAFSILITGAYLDPSLIGKGSAITGKAFGSIASVSSFMPTLLTISCIFFAYSTIISWCYYGEKATQYLWGKSKIKYYRFVFVIVTCLGPVLSLQEVLVFSDVMQLALAFPNVIGMVLLSGVVGRQLKEYSNDLKNGKIHKQF